MTETDFLIRELNCLCPPLAIKFKIGQKVEATDIKQDHPLEKLADKQLGPYKILEKAGASSYKLKILTGNVLDAQCL
jgi:hypothetical protein